VGATPVDHSLTIDNTLIWSMTEKKLMGCFLGSCNSARDIPRLVALWRTGQLDLDSLVTTRRPIDEINEGLADLAAGAGIRTVFDLI
jgi:S-(hydroxymethyl)glutathione dehydrogenase / alcohol dehydrogenase